MNYGMIVFYLFSATNVLIAARTTKDARMFWGSMVNLAILNVLLAWSHGWHLTWAPK